MGLVILRRSLCRIVNLLFAEMFFFGWILRFRNVVKAWMNIKMIY